MHSDPWTAVRQAQEAGNSLALREAYLALLRVTPADPAANNGLGLALLSDGDCDAAEEHFLRAIESDANAPQLWLNVAAARRLRGDDAGEGIALQRALSINQRDSVGLIRLAQLHERLGEHGAALYRWSAVTELLGQQEGLSPAFLAALDHARDYVASSAQALAAKVDLELEEAAATMLPGELARAKRCLDVSLGRGRIYSNECHGLHYPFLPAEEFFDPRHFAWLDGLTAHFAAVREEALSLLASSTDTLEPYVRQRSGGPITKWSALSNSLDWSVSYFYRYGEPDEITCRRFPATAALLKGLPLADMPQRAPTAFFSVLRPHTRLPAHTGVSNVRAICHLPLVVPDGCGFRVGGETRVWQEGVPFVFDDTIEHEAWNDSDAPRVVLIFDVWNPHISSHERQVLRRYFELADAEGFGPVAAVADD